MHYRLGSVSQNLILEIKNPTARSDTVIADSMFISIKESVILRYPNGALLQQAKIRDKAFARRLLARHSAVHEQSS
jgi:hypothetical protein